MTMHAFIQELKKNFKGEIHTDPVSRQIYSIDASIYEIYPSVVAVPRDLRDLVTAVQMAYVHDIPVTPRGAATGITGGCLGNGLILDLSKYLDRILEINYDEEYAICEPGVIQDRLNEALAARGYRLGPDTSTGNRATLGGMMANNAAGSRSLYYGRMVDHVKAINLVMGSGEVLHFNEIDALTWQNKREQTNQEGKIYKAVWEIKNTCEEEIRRRFPPIPRRVSGYNLDEILRENSLNISRLIVGSEGTLGVASRIKVKIAKKPKFTALGVIHFYDINEAMQSISFMLDFNPMALEMIDCKIIEMGRLSPIMKNKLEWLRGNPAVIFAAEFHGNTPQEAEDKLRSLTTALQRNKIGYAHTILSHPQEIGHVWEIRKAGLGLLLSKRSYNRAIAFIEDLSIPPQHLAKFMNKFNAYLKEVGKDAGIYGHVGSGCMHIRPYVDLRSPEEGKLMVKIMQDVSSLVLEQGGALSGEHGDGLIRSWLNDKMYGPQIMQAFLKLKQAFDPKNLMNPGKVVNGPSPLENLRLDPSTPMNEVETFLNFSKEGGLALAADLCNGNGLCRKKETIMCPSFQASGDEYDTTRARAQALRGIIQGKLEGGLSSQELYEILDLCLECKGCKTECPSQVDMAKMKAETLYHYQKKHGISLRSRMFGHVGAINHFFSSFPNIFNSIGSSQLNKKVLEKIGFATQRPIPQLASYRFSQWFKNQLDHKKSKNKVVLFNDTYTEFNSPSIGEAAYQLLNALGYEVIIPPWHCCGRPLISKGLLPQAKQKALRLIELLYPYAAKEIKIVGLEPSCILTIKDDYFSLAGSFNGKVEKIAQSCQTLDEFLYDHLKNKGLDLPFNASPQFTLVQGHCHQKSLVGMEPTMEVLKAVPGIVAEEIPSGCCGMAGSFGYEEEHYALSMKIGELKLFPAIRSSPADVLLISNGTSCRSQISQGTGRKALHLAEALAKKMK